MHVSELNTIYTDPTLLRRNPFLQDSLLIGQGGERVISKITPSIVHNTVDNPIFPTSGQALHGVDGAGRAGRQHQLLQADLEGVYFWKQNPRMSLGMRGQVEYIHQFTGSVPLPIFEKLFLGGEYSVRGFDIRSHRAVGSVHGPRARRQQEPALQHRAGVHDCRPGARDPLLRRRPGA